MEIYADIRRRVHSGELSLRQACSAYQLNFRTVQRIVGHSEPIAYQQSRPRPKPVLGPFLAIVHRILEEDRHAPPKQRHTARRIFDRLRDEHGYDGCASIVRAAVADWKQSTAEVFVPLLHPPGEAQADFGRAEVIVAAIRHKAALFVLTLPHSNARFAVLSPRECSETFHDGHARAFAFLGGVPRTVRYDNSRLAVVKVKGTHSRQLSGEFLRLAAHFDFAHVFCGVRQAQEKGHVENGVGYVRRNFLVPVPAADSWEQLNDQLTTSCQREIERGRATAGCAIAALLRADKAAMLPLPAEAFVARRIELVTINSLSLGRFDGNDYSVPVAMAYRTLTATGTIDSVRFSHQGKIVAVHRRCWGKGCVTFEPLHYLALLSAKAVRLRRCPAACRLEVARLLHHAAKAAGRGQQQGRDAAVHPGAAAAGESRPGGRQRRGQRGLEAGGPRRRRGPLAAGEVAGAAPRELRPGRPAATAGRQRAAS
jgi:transposase